MQRARSQLRVLGVQDWRIDYQEFVSLLGSFELNMDWEQSFQKLRSTAPIGIAESIPNSMLAALANQLGSLDSQVTRGVVLRDIETAPAAYPTSRYRRLLAAANLFRFVDRTMAIQFYEGAIRTISSLRELGYGNDAHWKNEEVFLKQSIITLNHPELIAHSDPRGQELRLRTLKNVGTSQYDSKDYVAAEKTFQDLLEFTKSLTEKEPNSLSLQCEVALAYGWLASTKNALGESDVGLAFSDQDVALSEFILQKFPDVRESQMNLARAYEFRYGIFSPLNQMDQKLQATMKAIDLLEAILRKRPNDGGAQIRLILSYNVAGGIYYDKEEFETAKSFYEKALPMAEKRVASEPNSSTAVSDVVLIQTRLGMVAYRLKDLAEASDRFNKASAISRSYVSTHREDPIFLRLLADSLNWSSIASWRRSQPEELLEFLKQEIAVRKRLLDFGDSDESNLLVAISSRVDVLKKLGRFDESLTELNDSLRRMDKNPDLFHLRGQIHYENSEIQLAIDDCTRAIELDSNQAKYFRSRAEVYNWDEKFDLAEKDYSRAIELEPSAKENWLARANFLSSRGRWSEAIQDFERWLKFSPKDGFGLNMAGATYFRSGNISRSKELFQTAIEIDPQDGMAHRNLGKAYIFEKNWELASQHYEKSMLHNGPFPQAWNEALLVALKLEGKNREDIFEEMVFRFANEPNDTNAKTVVWAGVRFPLSSSAAKQLREWNAQWPSTLQENPLDLRVRGALALRLKDYHSAESQLRKWLNIDANKEDMLAQLLLVIALTKQSRLDEATTLLAATKKGFELKAKEEAKANSSPSAWLEEIEASILFEEAEKTPKE
jgi:tetratricopeptide (TPR) repeat protein